MKNIKSLSLLLIILGVLSALSVTGCEDPTEITYALRDTGPAGGLIFYENPDYGIDGWRYLEAAPYGWYDGGDDPGRQWGCYEEFVNCSDTEIGSGKSNTEKIVTLLTSLAETDRAAQLCDDLVFGDYDDWFLPSEGELIEMRTALQQYGLGDFSALNYWSSSENGNDSASRYGLSSGIQSYVLKTDVTLIRPVRAF